MTKRKYTLKQRAEDKQATRERIVDAAMRLHGEVGPRDTTISAIAARAGVQRLTVYRHFTDEAELFEACSSKWLELNPPPSPPTWEDAETPEARTRLALEAFYAYYARTRQMWVRVYRDAELEALRAPLAGFESFLDGVGADLAACWRPAGRKPKRLTATIRHTLEFATWRSLSERGLGDKQAARLAAAGIAAAPRP